MKAKMMVHFMVICLFGTLVAYAQQSEPDFITAIRMGNIELVKQHIEKGVDVNLQYNGRHTSLIVAILSDQPEIARLLIASGADVNLVTEKEASAINTAAMTGNIKCISLLLEKDVELETRDNEGKTPLMNAIYNKHAEAAALLIKAGSNVNMRKQRRF
jgi:ankyrin repeat protein